MKYVGLLLSSIFVFLIVLTNLYCNSVTLDIKHIKDYVLEANIILEDVLEKEEKITEKKGEYISRLMTLKKGMENSKTSFLVKDFKEYKVKSIENLIYSLSEEKNKDEYIKEVYKYNELSGKELDKLINKQFIKRTYLSTNTYT
ncbi:hypothetical protein CHL78_019225 [Romboutsia weinsteinii]|uniref:DUF4363 family protein n=1 Tax=Romboutsia weinsteinii TaxID=2020949 RepID=A0A371IXN3_9FIRM|nr:hypothetical protein [Romboutsia weinsteinii]RDY25236.1 hypothetical protein CHL78_019225 [Romboutsia weinsteinii]